MNKREANARYYAAHRDRIILRESELRPSTILDCLGDQELRLHDKRLERLERLFVELTGIEPRKFTDVGGVAARSAPAAPPAQRGRSRLRSNFGRPSAVIFSRPFGWCRIWLRNWLRLST